MTNQPAVITGVFADLKSVRTRSVAQLVIEIPIEHAEAAIKAFGYPQPGKEVNVAIARLNGKGVVLNDTPQADHTKLMWDAAQRLSYDGDCWHDQGLQQRAEAAWDISKQIYGALGYPPDTTTIAGQNEPSNGKPHSYAVAAAIMCGEPAFWRWVTENDNHPVSNAEEAAGWLRTYCEVESRSEIKQGTAAGSLFRDVRTGYRNWLAGMNPDA